MTNETKTERALIKIATSNKDIAIRTGWIVKTLESLKVNMKKGQSIRPCWYKTEKEKKKALFHGLIQEVKNNTQVTFALLEFEDGTLKRADIGSVIFVDNLFAQFENSYVWEEDE